jgi:hypothetical protein
MCNKLIYGETINWWIIYSLIGQITTSQVKLGFNRNLFEKESREFLSIICNTIRNMLLSLHKCLQIFKIFS